MSEPASIALSAAERDRYARQLAMAEWSPAAQAALRAASVLVVGAGALGSPAALYLAGAGVGRLAIADADRVELSNLHRQLLHGTPDIGAPKAQSAAAAIARLNPGVAVEPIAQRLEEESAAALVAGRDVVLDCTDAYAARTVVNAACCAAGVALVEGGALRLGGMVLTVRPGESACYRCVFPAAPAPVADGCAPGGVLGPVPGVVGSLMALEAIKLLAGIGTSLTDTLLEVDAGAGRFTRVAVRRDPRCPDCGG